MFTNLGLALMAGFLTQAPAAPAQTAEAAVTAALAKATTPAECVQSMPSQTAGETP